MLSEIAQAVGIGSKVAGMFGPSDERMARRTTTQHFKNVRDGALAAGFNPAFALASGAGGTPRTGQSPLNSRLDSLGGALIDFADMLDPVRAETERLNNEILTQEVIRLKRSNQNPFGVPGMQRTSSPVKTTNPGEASPEAVERARIALEGTQTAFGSPLSPQNVADGAIVVRETDNATNSAYSLIDTPAWWPSADHIEFTFGDDGFVTNLHGALTPIVVGVHNWDEYKDIGKQLNAPTRRRDAQKEYGTTREQARKMTLPGYLPPTQGGKSSSRKKGR